MSSIPDWHGHSEVNKSMPEPPETYGHQRWEGFGFPPYRRHICHSRWVGDALFERMWLRLFGCSFETSLRETYKIDYAVECDIRDFYDEYVTKFRESEDSYALYKQILDYITRTTKEDRKGC